MSDVDDGEVSTETIYTGPVPPFPAGLRALDEIGDELADEIGRKDALEAEKASVMKDYNQRIGVLEARCSELAANYREAKEPASYDYENGWKHIFDGHTQQYLRSEHIPANRQPSLPATDETIGNTPITVTPVATFDRLTVGSVWEHEMEGVCQIRALEDGSVYYTSEDLNVPHQMGTRDAWNAWPAHPREVPELAVGQVWCVGGGIAVITALDDVAACVRVGTDQGDAVDTRYSRLSFCAAAARQLQPLTVADLQVGTRVRLDAGPVVEVKAVVGSESEESILIEYEEASGDHAAGDQEQVGIDRFVGGEVMALSAASLPEKRKRGRPRKQPATAAEV